MAGVTLSEFSDKMNNIMPIILREYMKNRVDEFHKVKVTLPQFIVLHMLKMHGECKMTDLAHFMNVTTAAMTGIVDKLVRNNCVVRVNDPADRRIVKIKLMTKGENILKIIREDEKKITMEIFGMISQKERDDYLKILQHIQEHLDAKNRK
ncbi:MAG: MarR family transcriptional regulator [Candidatus Omnitrophota bacterium]|jgi:DNA-binding MarR family transcriptional regulator